MDNTWRKLLTAAVKVHYGIKDEPVIKCAHGININLPCADCERFARELKKEIN